MLGLRFRSRTAQRRQPVDGDARRCEHQKEIVRLAMVLAIAQRPQFTAGFGLIRVCAGI